MSEKKVYLDYNATTPLEPEVLEIIHTALEDAWGNPSSSHDAGKKAKDCIDDAREKVAKMIGAKSSDIVFTSGGTEANNMVLQTAVQYFHESFKPDPDQRGDVTQTIPNIISSRIEHPAVNEYLQHLQNTGQADITYVPVSMVTGRVEAADIVAAVKNTTILVTVMLANNETGIIQNVSEISRKIHSLQRNAGETPRILVHTDAAQAIGKIPVNVVDLGVDYLTIVGHKFYGPRIGALYARDLESRSSPLFPMLFGGGQERSYRPGTENTGMIAGLGKACQLVSENLLKYADNMRTCRNYLEDRLNEVFEGKLHFNGKISGTDRLPNTCNVSLLGDRLQGFQVLSQCKVLQASIGAACHLQNRVSPILTAIGVDDKIARNAIRLSLGRNTTKQDIDVVVDDLEQAVKKILEVDECT